MTEAGFDMEALLRSALTPVDPPEALSDRLERHLTELTDLAAEELADWELSTMRDPRNWVRPAAAVWHWRHWTRLGKLHVCAPTTFCLAPGRRVASVWASFHS